MTNDNDDVSEKTSIIPSDTFKGRIKQADDSPPVLVVLMGPPSYIGKQFALTQTDLVIGRAIDSQIFIDDKSVSRAHAKFAVYGNEVSIIDLGASNKTVVNSQVLNPLEPYKLKNNDQIKTGNVIFKYLEKGSVEAIATKDIYERALKDALTGAYSKGALLDKGPEAMKRAELLNEPLSIITFDIDHFKKINDTYGHPAGDYVLKELCRIISSKLIRSNDYFARFGGEEFVLLLSGSTMSQSLEVAERIRATIQNNKFEFESTIIPVTISLGVATREPADTDWQSIYKRADSALYHSKHNGRNRVSSL